MGSGDEAVQLVLQYCFQETIRNVFEHAQVDSCIVMAQRYDTEFEVSVADDGRGVHASLLASRPDLAVDDALRSAILPGVSGNPITEESGEWGNTGFGLYVLSELCKERGHFSLWSSGNRLNLKGGALTTERAPFVGTAIRVRVDTVNAEYFPNQLAAIVKTGESQLQVGSHRTGRSKGVGGWSG